MSERRRIEQEKVRVSSGAADLERERIRSQKQKAKLQEEAHKKAVSTFKKEVTPIEERTREIIQERSTGKAKSKEAGRATRKKSKEKELMREGKSQTEASKLATEEFGEVEAVESVSNDEARQLAKVELLDQGFTEEQLETPYSELGGDESTGFLPSNVVGGRGKMGEVITGVAPGGGSIGVMPRDRAVQRRPVGRGAAAIGGLLFFGALVSFGLITRKG